MFSSGDMNCSSSTRHIDIQLQQIIDVYDLCQYVLDFTHGVTLDLVITQPQNSMVTSTAITNVDDIGLSDH